MKQKRLLKILGVQKGNCGYTKEQRKVGLTEIIFAHITVQRFFYDLSPAGDYWKLEVSSTLCRLTSYRHFLSTSR